MSTEPDSMPVLGDIVGAWDTGSRLVRIVFVICVSLSNPSLTVIEQVMFVSGGSVPVSVSEELLPNVLMPSLQLWVSVRGSPSASDATTPHVSVLSL